MAKSPLTPDMSLDFLPGGAVTFVNPFPTNAKIVGLSDTGLKDY